jgi:hypothetical protein
MLAGHGLCPHCYIGKADFRLQKIKPSAADTSNGKKFKALLKRLSMHTKTLLTLLFFLFFVQTHSFGQWTKLPKAENLPIRQIIQSGGRFLCSTGNGLAASTDGGKHWQRLPTDDRFKHLAQEGDTIYGLTEIPLFSQFQWKKSTDFGQTWSPMGSPFQFYDLGLVEKAGDCFYLTKDGGLFAPSTVYRYDPDSEQLSLIYTGDTGQRMYDMLRFGNTLLIAWNKGMLQIKDCDQPVESLLPDQTHYAMAVRNDTIFSLNSSFTFLYSTDSGDSWQHYAQCETFLDIPQRLYFQNGETWVVSKAILDCDHRIYRFNSSHTSANLAGRFIQDCVNDMMEANSDTMLLATNRGMCTFDIPNNKWVVGHKC